MPATKAKAIAAAKPFLLAYLDDYETYSRYFANADVPPTAHFDSTQHRWTVEFSSGVPNDVPKITLNETATRGSVNFPLRGDVFPSKDNTESTMTLLTLPEFRAALAAHRNKEKKAAAAKNARPAQS